MGPGQVNRVGHKSVHQHADCSRCKDYDSHGLQWHSPGQLSCALFHDGCSLSRYHTVRMRSEFEGYNALLPLFVLRWKDCPVRDGDVIAFPFHV